jgi:acyl carrier protein
MPGAKRPELDTTYIAARNELEMSLVEIWKGLLGFGEIGIDDNFFDLGGDSLLLMQLQLKILQTLGTDLSSAEMFQHPTIGSLTKRLSQKPTEESGGLEAIHDRAQMQRAAMTRGFQRRNPVATE